MPLIKIESFTQFNISTRERIEAIDSAFFPQPWGDASWKGVGETDHEYFLTVGKSDGGICAFALYLLSPHEGLAHLLKLLVIPEFRGSGLGLELLTHSFIELDKQSYRKKYLEVAVSNHSAIAIYQKVGLIEVNRVKKFYSNGEDAIIMVSPN